MMHAINAVTQVQYFLQPASSLPPACLQPASSLPPGCLQPVSSLPPACLQPASPYGFYFHTVGETVAASLSNFETNNAGREPDSVFKFVYCKLASADAMHWQLYWERRVRQAGLDPEEIRQRLVSLRPSVTQGERWHCLRMHLKALPTARRLRSLSGVDEMQSCLLCGQGSDCQLHIFGPCEVARGLMFCLQDGVEDFTSLTYEQHCLSTRSVSCSAESMLKLNDVILNLRRLSQQHSFHDRNDIVQHGVRLFRFPGLRGGAAGVADRSRRRFAQPNLREGYALYRVHATSARTGPAPTRTGWGAVSFGVVTARRQAVPVVSCWDYAGEGSQSNACSYKSVMAALEHAVEHGHANVCIQSGNTLVVKQATSKWACRAPGLQGLLARLWELERILESRGGHVIIEHIAKHWNGTAVSFANRAITQRRSCRWVSAGSVDL